MNRYHCHKILSVLSKYALVSISALLLIAGCQAEQGDVESTEERVVSAQAKMMPKEVGPKDVGSETGATKAQPSAQTPRVYFIKPQDGATVGPKSHIVFGLAGMGVAPAGIDKPNTGHHHLLINGPELPAPGMPLPATDQIVHFGGGQTETWIDLPPGQHTLQLLLGDFAHRPHQEPIKSSIITVTVVE